MPRLTAKALVGTSKRASSWRQITSCIGVPPRPPKACGQVMAPKPAAALRACQSRPACMRAAASSPAPKVWSERVLSGALRDSQSRHSARKAASSGVSSKSMEASAPWPGEEDPLARTSGSSKRPTSASLSLLDQSHSWPSHTASWRARRTCRWQSASQV